MNFTSLKKHTQNQSSIPQGTVPARKKVSIVAENGLMGSGIHWRYNLEKNLLFQSELFHRFHRCEVNFSEHKSLILVSPIIITLFAHILSSYHHYHYYDTLNIIIVDNRDHIFVLFSSPRNDPKLELCPFQELVITVTSFK